MTVSFRAISTSILLCIPFVGLSQSSQSGIAAHGTVNIFLANGNGLIAVTDSKISAQSGPLGYGQKLFKLDDRTICSIAGFFSWSGPVMPGNIPSMLPTSAPAVLNGYIQDHQRYLKLHQNDPQSLQSTFSGVLKAWTDGLDLMRETQGIFGQQIKANEFKTVITIAGYERGELWVGQTAVILDTGKKSFTLEPTIPVLHEVGNRLSYVLAGEYLEVLSILNTPSKYGYSNPSLAAYYKSQKADQGSSLNLADLKALAEKLESIAAREHPSDVGGQMQFAVLSDDNVSYFDSPPSSQPSALGHESMRTNARNGYRFGNTYTGSIEPSMLDNFSQLGYNSEIKNGLFMMRRLPPATFYLVKSDSFTNELVELGGLVILGSTFTKCTLLYDGSPIVFFSDKNTLVDTDLLLGPHTSRGAPFVKDFRKMYPDVRISQWRNIPNFKTHSGVTIR